MSPGSGRLRRTGHHVVVGSGPVGAAVVRELRRLDASVVIIERLPERLRRIRDMLDDEGSGCVALIGDAFDEVVFDRADIEGAVGLALTLTDERDNLFLALQARQANPGLRVVSRVSNENVGSKFRTVGVETVVSPARLGGVRLAHELLHPELATFAEDLLATHDRTDLLMEIEVSPESEVAGKQLGEVDIKGRTGCMIMGISRRATGNYTYHPSQRARLRPRSVLVALGEANEIVKLQALLSGEPSEVIVASQPPASESDASDAVASESVTSEPVTSESVTSEPVELADPHKPGDSEVV